MSDVLRAITITAQFIKSAVIGFGHKKLERIGKISKGSYESKQKHISDAVLRAFAYLARCVKIEIELNCSIIGFVDKKLKKLIKGPNKMMKVSKTK